MRVVATVTDLIPWSAAVWSPDERSVSFTVAPPPSESGPGTPPRIARLQTVDLATGAPRTVREFVGQWPVIPLVARADLIAGFELPLDAGSGRYLVLEPTSGRELAASLRQERYTSTSFVVSPDTSRVIARTQRVKADEPTTLLFWPPEDYARRQIVLTAPTVTAARPWPGRDEFLVTVAHSGAAGYELLAVSPNGMARSLIRASEPLSVISTAPDGSAVLLDKGVAHELVVYPLRGGTVGGAERVVHRPAPAGPPLEFIGWVAGGP